LLLVGVLGWPRQAAAIEPRVESHALVPAGANAVDPFAGAFNHTTKLTVPAFRGLEPQLALHYSSSRGPGTIGVGWSLGGLTFVERRGPRKSVAQYDATDVFWLEGFDDEGLELMPCTALGGTHCTKQQRFVRVRYVAESNLWEVTSKNGIRRTFKSRQATSAGTFRWYLTSVEDTNGNRVVYSYWNDAGRHTYLDTVTYNGTEITLYWEARPDRWHRAIGGAIVEIRYRLRSVDMKVLGARARSYALAYAASTSDSSELASLRQCGRDCTVSASGVVSGGTWLPAQTFAYDVGGTGFKSGVSWSAPTDAALQWEGGSYEGSRDRECIGIEGCSPDAIAGGEARTTGLLDMDGDGRPDFIHNGQVYLNNGGGFVASSAWGNVGILQQRVTYWGGLGMQLSSELTSALVDLDGDGRPDRITTAPTSGVWSVSLNTGRGFANPTSWAAGPLQATVAYPEMMITAPMTDLKDMDGDGLKDYISLAPTGALSSISVRLNTGHGFTAPRAWTLESGATYRVYSTLYGGFAPLLVDINGDGLTDLIQPHSIEGSWWVALNHGKGFAAPTRWIVPAWAHAYSGLFGVRWDWWGYRGGDLEDMNGDGRPDLVFGAPGQALQVWLNTGTGFASALPWGGRATWIGYAEILDTPNPCDEWGVKICSRYSSSALRTALIDLDGDGLVDRVNALAGGWTIEANNGATVAGLMTAAHGELGGELEVDYRPSSEYSPTLLPNVQQVVSAMTATDGRGGSVATRYEYAGALWSADEARFLGFRRAKMFDATGAYQDHLFTQNVADPNSTREARWVRDADGKIISYDTFTYARAGNGSTTPYRSLPSEKWAYQCNGNASCKRTLTTYAYDGYGDRTLTIEHGDADVLGDERTVRNIFVPNTTDYLVNYPAQTMIYEDAGTSGALLQHHRMAYDGQAVGVAPVSGNLTRKEARLIEENRFLATTMTYDLFGNRRSETDPLGRTTNTAWDATFHLYPIRVTDPLGHVTQSGWHAECGAPRSTIDANGRVTSFDYDPLCRAIRETRPDGGYVRLDYLAIGDPQNQRVKLSFSDESASGEQWQLGYLDGLGRFYRTVKEGDRTVDIGYDGRGLETRRSVPYATGDTVRWVRKERDAARRLTRTVHPDGTAGTVEYLDWGTRSIDELGKPIQHLYDGYGRLSETTEWNAGDAYRTASRYDLLGRLVRITDASGNVTVRDFDSLGRKLMVRDPDMGTWRYAYDDAGNLVSQTDAKGQLRSFTYDAGNRLRKKLHGTTTLATFRYDEPRAGFFNVGHLTTMIDPSGNTVRDYDALGRLARETKTIGDEVFTFAQSYDLAGRLASLEYPDGEIVRYRYNAAGDLIAAGPYATGAIYDARGKIVSRTLGNGLEETFSYDPRRYWLTRIEVRNPAGTLVDEESYSWDARGEIVAKSSTRNARENWEYRYDDLRRLTRAVNLTDPELTQAFSYDAIGNIVGQTGVGTYVYPASGDARPHAPLSVGARALSYDRNGNRVSDGSRRLDYDVENRLVAVDGIAYAYDGEGTRVRAGNTIEASKYVEKTGDCVRKYYYFGDLRVARRDCTREVFYYHSGYDRSTRKMTDASGGEARRHVLTPFGQITNALGIADPFGLAGERFDASGLYHMGARYLDPVLGQFTQPDPSADPDPARPQTLNRYAYAYNNPIRISDPSGYDGDAGDGDDGSADGGEGDGAANDAAAESSSEAEAEAAPTAAEAAVDEATAVAAPDVAAVEAPSVAAVEAPDVATVEAPELATLEVPDITPVDTPELATLAPVEAVKDEVIDAKVTIVDEPTVKSWDDPDRSIDERDIVEHGKRGAVTHDRGIPAPAPFDQLTVDPKDVKDGKVPGVISPDTQLGRGISDLEAELNGTLGRGWDI
jgi:RHS repeat-associated protein